MTTVAVENEEYLPFDSVFLNDQAHRIIESVLPKFTRLLKRHLLFHIFFFVLGITEISLLILFTTYLVQSSLLAITLATIFLTFFSYFTLKLFLQTKKPGQIKALHDMYIRGCKHLVNFDEELPEHHLALANGCTKFAVALQGKESQFYPLPRWLDFLSPTLETFSSWWHWYDIHSMRERLLTTSINEHIKLVKLEPTDLEVHAALANSYVLLSSLYAKPHAESFEDERWSPPEKFQRVLKKKFRATAEKAIEEFIILNDYAPDDPWVHAQLAYSYHDLGMPEKEIQEYETILRLCPDDKDTLYKLGVLYFQQGHNAKGLQIYEELRMTDYKRAEHLIQHYA